MSDAERKTRIKEHWQPDDAGRAFAAANGVPDSEVAAFVDFHLAKGDTMLSWPAAWRTWCRNAVRFGTATGKPVAPLLSLAFDAADSWGINAWVRTLPDAKPDTIRGVPCTTVYGVDVHAQARDCCAAAGFPESWRGDLTPVADWLRVGLDPDGTVEAIRTSGRPNTPTLRFFDSRVRGWQQRKVG